MCGSSSCYDFNFIYEKFKERLVKELPLPETVDNDNDDTAVDGSKEEPSATKLKIIGVDPGTTTGIAIKEDGKLTGVLSLHHNDAFQYIEHDLSLTPKASVIIVIEDARKRKWYGDKSNVKLQGAGAIKCLCGLWEHWTKKFDEITNITVDFIHPIVAATKLDKDQFNALTGWSKTTNEHSRDAGAIAHLYASRYIPND